MYSFSKIHIVALSVFALSWVNSHAAHPSRGLWVGEVTLNAVNEATGAVGDSNTYEFSDPEVPTPTSDAAYLRLILHVNGAGQVSLLKSVAIVQGDVDAQGNSEPVLLTNPELYSNYPGIAKRVASAFFDFGHPQAVDSVQELIDAASSAAATQVLSGQSEAQILEALTNDGRTGLLDEIVDPADVATAYYKDGAGFLLDDFFTLADVMAIADEVATMIDSGTAVSFFDYDPSATYAPFDPLLPDGDFSTVVSNAEALRDASFYGDDRGVLGVVDIVTSAARASVAGVDLQSRKAEARLAAEAAWHNTADIDQSYNRFLASDDFRNIPDSILEAVVAEAIAAEARGETESEISDSVRLVVEADGSVILTSPAATALKTDSEWGDPRAEWALESLKQSAIDSATEQVLLDTDPSVLRSVVSQAVDTTFTSIDAGTVFASAPSVEYSDFVTGDDYQTASDTIAETAASEAIFQYSNNVTDFDDLVFYIERAVSNAVIKIRNDAAALPMNSVQFDGVLAAGETVNGEFFLPSLAPSNPFLHRQHPDHSEGYAITRSVTLTVNTPEDGASFVLAGYGVSRLTGDYLEEIHGLHKPLGNNQDVGLKTQGTFILNRLTLVDTLNF